MKKVSAILASLLASSLVFASSCQAAPVSHKTVTMGKSSMVNLKVAFLTLGVTPAHMSLVQQKLSAYAQKKIGATITLEPISVSAYANQMNLTMASNQQLDLAMISGNDMGNYVARGYLTDITAVLKNYGKGITSALGTAYLKAGQVNNKQYVVASVRDMAASYGITLRKDLVTKYKLDFSKVKTLSDLTPILKKLSAEKNIAPIGPTLPAQPFLSQYLTYDKLGDGYGVLLNRGQTTKVVDWYETSEYTNDVKLMRQWYQAGIIYKDSSTTQESDATLVKEGKIAGYFNPQKPGIAEQDSAGGITMAAYQVVAPFATTSSINSINWGIPHNCGHLKQAMQFLNLMYSDSTVVNLLDYGVQGTDYVLTSGSKNVINFPKGITATNSKYNLGLGWEFGNQLISYVWKGTSPDIWSQMKKFNSTAIHSKALGFVFDSSSVKTEEANVANVVKQYGVALECGAVDPNTYLPQFKSALQNAGINTIVKAKQTQLDKWMKTTK